MSDGFLTRPKTTDGMPPSLTRFSWPGIFILMNAILFLLISAGGNITDLGLPFS